MLARRHENKGCSWFLVVAGYDRPDENEALLDLVVTLTQKSKFFILKKQSFASKILGDRPVITGHDQILYTKRRQAVCGHEIPVKTELLFLFLIQYSVMT